MRTSRSATLVLMPLLLAALPAALSADSSVDSFLAACKAAQARIDGAFAPDLVYDSWEAETEDDFGESDRRPESVGAGVYPRVVYEKLEVGDVEATSLLGQDRASGRLWQAWVGLGEGCLILEGTASELVGDDAKLTTSADGKKRVLEVGDLRVELALAGGEIARDPDDIADCFACKESSKCQSRDCSGPPGGKLCRPKSGTCP